jgi:hypothetical protein
MFLQTQHKRLTLKKSIWQAYYLGEGGTYASGLAALTGEQNSAAKSHKTFAGRRVASL